MKKISEMMKKFLATLKKHAVKIISIALATALLITIVLFAVNGRDKNKIPDTDQTLQVYVFEAGYGTKWCTDMLDLFKEQAWVKEKYPNLNIPTPTINDVSDFAESRLIAGEKGNTFDLMFAINLDYNTGPDGDFLDLTDVVYGSKVPGEETQWASWSEKSLESYNESNTYIDATDLSTQRQYLTSWAGGMNTILYNETQLMQFTDKLPNTTDELLALCAAVKANKGVENGKYNEGYSFMEYGTGSYFVHMMPIYWAQYEGLTNYKNFWNGIDQGRYSQGIFDQKGRLYALEVMEEILDAENEYLTRSAPNYEFMQAQTLFLQGHGLFFCNGDWFDNEMKTIREQIIKDEGGIDTFKTMRMPIISNLGVKLGITDAELSAIVDYVDGTVETAPTFTSTKGKSNDEVIAAVKEARTVVHSLGPNHQAGIPVYAQGKEVAIDFLRFMATDIAQESYIKSTGGASLPFKYKLKEKNIDLYNQLGTMQQTRHDYFSSSNYEVYTLPSNRAFPLFQYGGLKAFTREDYFTDFFAAEKKYTAQDYFTMTKEAWTQVKWDNALSIAGLQG